MLIQFINKKDESPDKEHHASDHDEDLGAKYKISDSLTLAIPPQVFISSIAFQTDMHKVNLKYENSLAHNHKLRTSIVTYEIVAT